MQSMKVEKYELCKNINFFCLPISAEEIVFSPAQKSRAYDDGNRAELLTKT